jgi:plastocyanin
MRKRSVAGLVVVVAAIATIGSTATIASASGGGGCGGPVTDATGTTVRIRNFCFLPTILRNRPGQAVSFDNRDGFPHVVLGANAVWGSFSQLRARHDVTYRFTRTGTYPYVCTYHPGMVGAIVVGNGKGHGPQATVTAAGPVIAVPPASTDVQAVATDAVGSNAPATPGRWYEPWQIVVLASTALLSLGFARGEWRRHRPLTA